MQVNSVLETDLDSAPLLRPVSGIMRDPTVRAHLLARLPHSLLFGCQGDMTSSQVSLHQVQQHQHGFGSQHHSCVNCHRHCHFHEATLLEPSFVEQHICAEDLTVEEAAALMDAMQHHQRQRLPGRQDVMMRAQGSDDANDDNDSEMDELMRVLGLPTESDDSVRASPFSSLVMGFNSSRPPPATPATLAERWMR
jgi:hypothetical protein